MKHKFFYDREFFSYLYLKDLFSFIELFSIIIAIFGGFLFCWGVLGLSASVSSIISFFIGIFELCRRYYLNRIYFRSYCDDSMFRYEHTIEFSNKSIIKSSYFGITELYWKSIDKVYRDKSNIVFLFARREYISVPNSSFTSEIQVDEFYNMAIKYWQENKH